MNTHRFCHSVMLVMFIVGCGCGMMIQQAVSDAMRPAYDPNACEICTASGEHRPLCPNAEEYMMQAACVVCGTALPSTSEADAPPLCEPCTQIRD